MTETRHYPWPSSALATAVMRANRKTGTEPEVVVRSELHRLGLRFRKNHRLRVGDLTTCPDIVFPRTRVAVYIDGCFWHQCPLHGNIPMRNTWYWMPKLRRNVERDLRTTDRLRSEGWAVLRFWEHQRPQECALAIADVVRAQQSLVAIAEMSP